MTESAPSPRTTAPRVVLVGSPGSGKTSVGRHLAKRWGVDFRDTDHDIEETVGQSVFDIFVERGEGQFRALERTAVASALAEHRGVLAIGGGAVLSAETRQLLVDRTVVHLRVGLAAAMQRLHMNRSRPLLVGNVRGRWQQLADERQPLYAEVETLAVDTDGQTPQQVADRIATELEQELRP